MWPPNPKLIFWANAEWSSPGEGKEGRRKGTLVNPTLSYKRGLCNDGFHDFFSLFLFLNVYLIFERQRESQAGSAAVSEKPDVGLELTTREMT